MEVKRIEEIFEMAHGFMLANIKPQTKEEKLQYHKIFNLLKFKEDSLTKISDLIEESGVIKSIKKILPEFVLGRIMDKEYHECLISQIDDQLAKHVLLNNIWLKENKDLTKWDYTDTRLHELYIELIDTINKQYQNNEYCDLTENIIERKFNDVLKEDEDDII